MAICHSKTASKVVKYNLIKESDILYNVECIANKLLEVWKYRHVKGLTKTHFLFSAANLKSDVLNLHLISQKHILNYSLKDSGGS